MTEAFTAPGVTVHLGDCLDILPKLPAGSVHAVITDAPYGLEFMGRDWDAPWRTGNGLRRSRNPTDAGRGSAFGRLSRTSPEYAAGPGYQQWCTQWAAACTRVLRPGGHLVTFGGTRTWHRLACGIEDAGLEIRDSIDWIYAQGFPKSLNVAKAMSASAVPGAANQARAWKGWGTALKPGHEPIVIARKPLRGTVAANVTTYQAGALHIDACRTGNSQPEEPTVTHGTLRLGDPGGSAVSRMPPSGRWPANVIFSHSHGCSDDRCLPGCPVAELAAQSGTRRSGANPARRHSDRGGFRDVYAKFAGSPDCNPARGAETGTANGTSQSSATSPRRLPRNGRGCPGSPTRQSSR
jgi:DNA methylase